MKQTYFEVVLNILWLECSDVVRTSIGFAGDEFETNGKYDGDDFWNGF